jgi:sugar phosphate isomerase/epimerase
MKTFLRTLLILCIAFYCFFARCYAQSVKPLFRGHPGVVSYTYRNYFAKDVPKTLDSLMIPNGFTDIEFSNLFGHTAAQLRAWIDARGIKCSSYGVSYDDFVNKTDTVAQNALTLGAQYLRVAGIPHKGKFTLDDAKMAVEVFNRIGKILKEKYGLTFVYHNHGFEFEPYGDGTLYDYIVQHTDPKYVSFELDILWAYFPGQDPAKLLDKYGSRYKLMHLKDLKKGVQGNDSGGTSPDNDVALGTGQLDIPAILKAANKAGIKHYYIEDESNNVKVQVPETLAYIKSLTW